MNKVPGPPKNNKRKQQIPGKIHKRKTNTTWSHLGGDLGGAQKCSGSPGLKKCYV